MQERNIPTLSNATNESDLEVNNRMDRVRKQRKHILFWHREQKL
jgi:hypothetical protein